LYSLGGSKRVTESGFAYDSTANVGRKRKAGGVCMDISPAAKIEGNFRSEPDDRIANH
jgi:hypothetical protein